MAAEDTLSGERVFVRADSSARFGYADVARDRPLTLVGVERTGQSILYGFIAGIRPEPNGELQAPGSDDLVRFRADWALPHEALLVLINADETSTEVPLAEVSHLYLPNRMSLHSRSTLLWKRLGPEWRERRNRPEIEDIGIAEMAP
ncbi:MAG: hypothetical protein ACNA7J_03910 [Wenzhouxiangella sp.]